jgi:hypothetical protein
MRVSILAEDNTVCVEGYPEKVDCSSLDEDIHAIQWYDGRGDIEYRMDHVNGTKKMNFCIVDFAPYQHLVDLWMIEAKKEPPPKPVPVAPVPVAAKSEAPVRVIAD